MNRWKENLDTKKRTGDGAARWARRIFCAFFFVMGCLVLADGVGDAVRRAESKNLPGIDGKAENRGSQSEGNVEQNLSGKSDSDASEPIGQPDFAVLKCQNPDVIAWIRIPGTHIDEPIVQTTDNELYRSIGLDGKPDPAGTIFLDCESAPDASDFHSIFYGHHMKDGSRFSELVRLKDEDFFQKHQTAYLYFPDGKRRTLRLIAALTAGSDGERRRTEFADRSELHSYIEEMTEECRFRELPNEAVSHLYSFVTCSYEFADARTIVYAVDE